VLVIQGDDDRNVHFSQMIDLVNRLTAQHVPFEQMVIPNEIHGFLRWHSWLKADKATAAFLVKELGSQ
jgi:dipeptidyl aminopeptidase/acylaminoacyl peptidase